MVNHFSVCKTYLLKDKEANCQLVLGETYGLFKDITAIFFSANLS